MSGHDTGMSTHDMIDGICELTIEVRDLDRSLAFYGGILGLRALSDDGDRIWLQVGSRARLGLWLPGAREYGEAPHDGSADRHRRRGKSVRCRDDVRRGEGRRLRDARAVRCAP